MPLFQGLGQLFQPSTIFTLATQLFRLRDRLSLRTSGLIPTPIELAIALRLHAADEDANRLGEPYPAIPPPHPTHVQRPTISNLTHYLRVSNAAYARTEPHRTALLNSLNLSSPLSARLNAEKWHPGYFLVHDTTSQTLILSIRGSKEVSDFLTNISADTAPFLDGYGHEGVIRSAENLYEILIPLISRLMRTLTHRPRHIMLCGHSLGGAVASATTLLFRYSTRHSQIPRTTYNILRSATCYSFSPPPFLSPCLRPRSLNSIITITHQLDIVPRLSARAVDRLLVTLSEYDWRPRAAQSIAGAASGFVPSHMGQEMTRRMSEGVIRTGVRGIAIATAALAARSTDGGRVMTRGRDEMTGNQGGSSFWRMALSATAFVTKMVGSQVESSHTRLDCTRDARARGGGAFANAFDMNEEDVEGILDEGPQHVVLAGCVWHLERPFTMPHARAGDAELPAGRLVWKDADGGGFDKVEVSAWMLHDHNPNVMLHALQICE